MSNMHSGYSAVNGINMYYEIYGHGKPLLLIHGGGSTIQTTFGRIIPQLSANRQVVAVELQAHGRTGDRGTYLSFEQDADDVATLLGNLNISQTDVLGFSNGGQTAIELTIRHPHLMNKVILASTFYNRKAAVPEFWNGFDNATLDDMPLLLRQGFLAANNDPAALLNMFNKDVQRMKAFKGWDEAQIQSIRTPVLVINANMDVGSPEHAVEMFRLIPDCELVILPGGHGSYLGAIESLPDGKWTQSYTCVLIEEFLDK